MDRSSLRRRKPPERVPCYLTFSKEEIAKIASLLRSTGRGRRLSPWRSSTGAARTSGASGRCSIHEAGGELAKPRGCRVYPATFAGRWRARARVGRRGVRVRPRQRGEDRRIAPRRRERDPAIAPRSRDDRGAPPRSPPTARRAHRLARRPRDLVARGRHGGGSEGRRRRVLGARGRRRRSSRSRSRGACSRRAEPTSSRCRRSVHRSARGSDGGACRDNGVLAQREGSHAHHDAMARRSGDELAEPFGAHPRARGAGDISRILLFSRNYSRSSRGRRGCRSSVPSAITRYASSSRALWGRSSRVSRPTIPGLVIPWR